MPNRHRSRELAVQFVYQWSLNPCELSEVEASAGFFWNRQTNLSEENHDYFLRVAQGTLQKLPEIDAWIEERLENWKFSRVDKVDLAVLRVACFELHHEAASTKADVPVIIDEAVEIAKKFGSKDSPSFVNGILDKVTSK